MQEAIGKAPGTNFFLFGKNAQTMLLIADSGSTKTDWVLVDEANGQRSLSTIGFNPLYHSEEFIAEVCRKEFDAGKMPYAEVGAVYYYGASVWDEEKADKIKKALSQLFHKAHIEVEHDLLGAGRAACQRDIRGRDRAGDGGGDGAADIDAVARGEGAERAKLVAGGGQDQGIGRNADQRAGDDGPAGLGDAAGAGNEASCHEHPG